MSTIETGVYALWMGAQTAKGSAVAAPAHRFKMVAGGWQAPRTDGTEQFSDLSMHGDNTDWVDTLVGNGSPGVEATPEELSWLLWVFTGAETTAAVVGPPAKTKHTTIPVAGLGKWLTILGRKGLSVLERKQFIDSMITQLVIEGGSGAKAIRATPSFVSLNPGIWKTSDPVAAMPAKVPFLYTDATGTFTLDTVVIKGHTQFTLTLNNDISPAYGDDNLPYDVTIGDPSIGLAMSMQFDADALAQFNKLVYGTATPAADAPPLKRLPALGSYSYYAKARDATGALNGDEFKLTVPGVKWNVPDAPDPNPGGGGAELALTGAPRHSGVNPLWTIDVSNDSAAHTVGT